MKILQIIVPGTYAQDVENKIDVIHDFAREKLNLSSDRMKSVMTKI
jgi:hypothetical protein